MMSGSKFQFNRETVGVQLDRLGQWIAGAETWQIAVGAIALVLVAVGLLPVVVIMAVVATLAMFARAWLVEFRHLIVRPDEAFPGRNDKLIWALLMIVIPPAGTYLFRSYRATRWPKEAEDHPLGW